MNDPPEHPVTQNQGQLEGPEGPFKIVQLVQAKGGSTVQDVVQQVFVGDYERLRDAYIHPSAVFERVQLENFIGREWLVTELDRFLEGHDRGYFVLEAEAGLGKTTFLAWLVRRRGYIHHFSELAPGLDNAGASIKNLATQLVLAYHLSAWEAEGVLPGAAVRPDFLYKLLELAAEGRPPGERIVIVVDALDEAGTPHNLNVLGLPQALPEGVYFILSQRPVPVALHVDTAVTPRHGLLLSAGSPENLGDMRRFLEFTAAWPGVARFIQASQADEEQFVSVMLNKCRGLWIYLHFLIPEIEQGERPSLELQGLPDGLTQYYAEVWSRWRDEERELWNRSYLPLLTTLSAAAEAVTIERMRTWLDNGPGVEIQEGEVQRLLNEDWRPFITVASSNGQKSYRFYHATVREFFNGRGDRKGLSTGEIALLDELAEATRKAHQTIASYYLATWGAAAKERSLEAGLPGLQDPQLRNLHAGYGLRYLALHLEAAGQEEDLHRLLRLERVTEHEMPANPAGWRGWWNRLRKRKQYRLEHSYENIWYSAKEASVDVEGYLADLTRARSLVDSAMEEEEQDLGERGKWIGLQCRYALTTASINSLAQNIPTALLLRLVESGLWTPEQGLALARQTPDASQRVEALARLAPHFRDKERNQILSQAQSTAQGIKDQRDRAQTLAWLAHRLPEPERMGVLQAALSAAEGIRDTYERTWVLAELAARLPQSERMDTLREALSVAQGIEPEDERARALAALGPYLPETWLREALSTAQQLEDEFSQETALVGLLPRLAELGHPREALSIAQGFKLGLLAEALAGMAPHLPETELREVLSTAVQQISAQQIHIASDKDSVQSRLAMRLAELGDVREALSIAQGIRDEYERPSLLAQLAYYVAEPRREQMLREALDAAQQMSVPEERDEMLAWLLPRLAELAYPREALSKAHQIRDGEHRVEALAGMAPYLPQTLLPEALSAARQIWDDSSRDQALANLLPRLAGLGYSREALFLARQIADEYFQSWILAGTAPHLPQASLGEALTLARQIRDGYSRSIALTGLIPYLPALDRRQTLRQALSTARWLSYGLHRAWALAGLAPYLAESKREWALRKALSAARRRGDFDERQEVLTMLAPRLPEALQSKALSIAGGIESEQERAQVLAGLAPHLPQALLREALSIGQGIENEVYQARALAALLSRLAALGHLEEALSRAQAIRDVGPRTQALAGLAPYLPEASLQEVLDSVPQIKENDDLAQALVRLAPYLPETWLREALSIAQGMVSKIDRSKALAALAPRLAQPENLQEALAIIRGFWYRPSKHQALADLALHLVRLPLVDVASVWPVLVEDLSNGDRRESLLTLGAMEPVLSALGGGEALLEAVQAIQDVGNWWP